LFYASAILNGSDGVWYAQHGKRPETFYIRSIAFRICGTGFKNHTKFRSSCGMHLECAHQCDDQEDKRETHDNHQLCIRR
jgi:hypothetical protein